MINAANMFAQKQLFISCFYCYINSIFCYDIKDLSNGPNGTKVLYNI